jgi:hypothetical protein
LEGRRPVHHGIIVSVPAFKLGLIPFGIPYQLEDDGEKFFDEGDVRRTRLPSW